MGRPKKYSAKRLAKEVDRYFASISRIVTVTERLPTGERDSKGHEIYRTQPVINTLGEEMKTEEFLIPPTVGGLCRFLGIHKSTWAEYCDSSLHPEFSDTTTRARGRLRAYLEQQLLTRKDVKGIIFDLQNNHGYTEKREVELGAKAAQAAGAAALSMGEKKELLRLIAADFTRDDDEGAGA